MADFLVTKIPEASDRGVPTGRAGVLIEDKRLLGDAGAATTGKGGWHRTDADLRTFFLHAADRKTAITTGVVQVHGTMELASAPDNPDNDTSFKILATLNAAGPSFHTEEHWRFVRAVVTTADAVPCQVAFSGQRAG